MTRSLLFLSLFAFGGLASAGSGDWELTRAAELPFVARDLRAGGVPEGEVRSALGAFQKAGVSAADAEQALSAAEQGVKRNGPIDNFGSFVQGELDRGLRGRELAATIRAEHEARGKGGGHGKSGEDHGKSGEDHGKSGEDHGKSGEDHGKSGEEHGKSGGKQGKGKGGGR